MPHLDTDEVKHLNALIEKMRKTDDARRWMTLNDEFHLRLYERAHRPRLSGMIANLRDASTPYIHMYVAGRPPAARANEEHQEILDACVRGDRKAAEAAIREHLRSASHDLVAFLSGTGQSKP